MIKNIKAVSLIIIFIIFGRLASHANTDGDKFKAYEIIGEALPKLDGQLVAINSAIDVAENKISESSSSVVKELFQSQLDKMEDQKESIEAKIAQLTSIIDELKKDPEVGSLIEGQEANRKMQQQLDKATSLLPKVD
jgi:hypothetical protein